MAVASVLDTLPIIQYSAINSVQTILSENDVTLDNHDPLLDQAVDQPRESLRSHHNEEQLLDWLKTNSTAKVAALILESNIHIQNSLSENDIYRTIRSILIRCRTEQLTSLQRFSRSYRNVDGIYDDDRRILVKLVIDLAFVSEELGDQEREDRNNQREARRHYDRALKLCEIAKQL